MSIMYKFLVLSCVLASCYSSPLGLEPWLREIARRFHGRGCADRAGWQACAGAAPAALAPHPRDCRYFYYCSSFAPPVCRPCPDGLYFNPELQVCDWPYHANCTAHPPPPEFPEITTWLPETDITTDSSGLLSTDLPSTESPYSTDDSDEDTSGTTDEPISDPTVSPSID